MGKVLFYSWKQVVGYCDSDPKKVLEFFRTSSKTGIPRRLFGKSFILNCSSLMDSAYYDTEKIDYISLCSIRNFFDYQYNNEAGLYKYFSPVNIEKLQHNRLLTIKNDYIKFKYEEINNGIKI